ncbi:ATP-binding protein [Flaviflagellibacter deserti]|uniref:histidine kinase n=1 Tax=Flaviflagellibacter deserti TaxID=2267266 RepID=A0ABV9Z1T2_9HYPH
MRLSDLMRDPDAAEDLEDLYENAPCGYLSLGTDARIVKANRTLATWTGFTPDELVGKRFHDLLNVAGRIFYETHFAPLLRMQGFFHEVALDLQTADGGRLPVLANAVERRDPDGALIFTRVTIFQAVVRRRHERELEERLHAERTLGELREQFIAVLGHDLRNPLAAISSGLRILAQEEQTAKSKKVIGLMQGSALRMFGLIDNVLDFARGRLGGGITLRLSHEALGPVLEHVVEELQTAYPERAVEKAIVITQQVLCDQARIAQLASNLLGNAFTHGAAELPVKIAATTEDGMFKLCVSNAGPPIPPEAMKQLFQPFQRGDRSSEGLGLGLHIASEIAKAHDGSLTVRSDANETCFTFEMPLTAMAERQDGRDGFVRSSATSGAPSSGTPQGTSGA